MVLHGHISDTSGLIRHSVQGDKERALGLPISPLMDRDQPGAMTRSQVPYMYTCICTYIYADTHVSAHVCVYMCEYIYMHLYIFII